MTTTMKAVVLTGHGGLDKLVYKDVPKPVPLPNQVLIRVKACGLNNTDVNTRSGWYSKSVKRGTTGDAFEELDAKEDNTWGGSGIKFPRIQGADVCGIVEAAGADADQSLIGKRVITDNWLRDWDDPLNMHKSGYYGSEADGGYAEYTVIDHRNARPVDSGLSDAELATFSCSYSTAEGMLARAEVGAGDVVLVTGASGGVGGALIQLSKRRGSIVVALASEEKHDQVAACGPDAILPRAPEDLGAALKEAIGRDTVTVVADIVAGPYFPTLIEALDRGGRYTTAGAIAGPIVDLDVRSLYLKDLTFTGSTVVPPAIMDAVVGYIERGEIKPMLAATYPLAEFYAAQMDFIAKTHTGNIVVIP